MYGFATMKGLTARAMASFLRLNAVLSVRFQKYLSIIERELNDHMCECVNSRILSMNFLNRGNFRFTKERRLIFGDPARPSRGRSYLHLAWRSSQWNQAIDEGRTNSLRGPLFETQRNISDRTLPSSRPALAFNLTPLETAGLRFSFLSFFPSCNDRFDEKLVESLENWRSFSGLTDNGSFKYLENRESTS